MISVFFIILITRDLTLMHGVGEGLIKNKKVRFNKDNIKKLADRLAAENSIYGETNDGEQWNSSTIDLSDYVGELNRIGIEALITDPDDVKHEFLHQIVVSNKEKLQDDYNLKVEFDHKNNNLVISRAELEHSIAGGKYQIYISTNDLNADANVIVVTDESDKKYPVVTTSITPLFFTVQNENIAPIVNADKLTQIKAQFTDLNLKQGDVISGTTIDIQDLFSDDNGDTTFEYSIENEIPGVTFKLDSGTLFALTGQPLVDDDQTIDIIATDNGGLTATAEISLNIEAGNSELLDTVTEAGSIWYQWFTKTDGEVSTPYCQGIKLTNDEYGYSGNFLSLSNAESCPSEQSFNIRKISGTWTGDNSTVVMTSNGGKELRFSGIESHIESKLASITTFEKLIQPRARMLANGALQIDSEKKYNGVTLYKGYEVAQNSYQNASAMSYVNNTPVIATADAMHKKYSNTNEELTVNVNFDKSCADMGITEAQTPIINRWEQVQAIVDGKAYDVIGSEEVAQPQNINATENCLIAFEMNDFTAMTSVKFNQPLAMNFIAKDGSNDSDMLVNTIFDKEGTIAPEYNLIITGDGEGNDDQENGVYIAFKYKDSKVKVVERFINVDGELKRDRSITGPGGLIFGAYKNVSEKYTGKYQAKNNNIVYEFSGEQTINIWSDNQGEVTIHTFGTDSDKDEEYKIYTSFQDARDSFKKID